MPSKQMGLSAAELTGLVKPLLGDEETIAYVADGTFSGLEAYDSLTIAVMKLTGKWKTPPFAIAVTNSRFHWIELAAGKVASHKAYKLPLKGRLVYAGRGVLEMYLPGEQRRFLQFHSREKARELYVLIDAQQQESKRDFDHLEEVVGKGTRPALVSEAVSKGAHGETLVGQHETIDLVRPSFRPERR